MDPLKMVINAAPADLLGPVGVPISTAMFAADGLDYLLGGTYDCDFEQLAVGMAHVDPPSIQRSALAWQEAGMRLTQLAEWLRTVLAPRLGDAWDAPSAGKAQTVIMLAETEARSLANHCYQMGNALDYAAQYADWYKQYAPRNGRYGEMANVANLDTRGEKRLASQHLRRFMERYAEVIQHLPAKNSPYLDQPVVQVIRPPDDDCGTSTLSIDLLPSPLPRPPQGSILDDGATSDGATLPSPGESGLDTPHGSSIGDPSAGGRGVLDGVSTSSLGYVGTNGAGEGGIGGSGLSGAGLAAAGLGAAALGGASALGAKALMNRGMSPSGFIPGEGMPGGSAAGSARGGTSGMGGAMAPGMGAAGDRQSERNCADYLTEDPNNWTA